MYIVNCAMVRYILPSVQNDTVCAGAINLLNTAVTIFLFGHVY